MIDKLPLGIVMGERISTFVAFNAKPPPGGITSGEFLGTRIVPSVLSMFNKPKPPPFSVKISGEIASVPPDSRPEILSPGTEASFASTIAGAAEMEAR